MKRKLTLFYLACLALGGCIDLEDMLKDVPVSLHPLYTKDDIVYEEGLVGTWEKDGDKLVFVGDPNEKHYVIPVSEDGNEIHAFLAHLIKIDETFFLDLASYSVCDGQIIFLMIPGHRFAKTDISESRLELSVIDITAMDPNVIDREVVDERIILTASPKELQQYLISNSNNPRLFSETIVYKKTASRKSDTKSALLFGSKVLNIRLLKETDTNDVSR